MPAKTGDQHGRDARGRWQPGVPGNPRGRPAGSRHRTSLAIEALLEGEAEGLTRKAVEMALGGDTTALRLCLERLVPPRKDKPVAITLPKLMAVGDLPSVTSAVLEAVASGDMTPSEGEAVSRLVEVHRRAVETAELDQRLTALEAKAQA
jgi:hypothetical protein